MTGDVRQWLAARFPDAAAWQLDLAERIIAESRERRQIVICRPRRFGHARVNSMIQRYLDEQGQR